MVKMKCNICESLVEHLFNGKVLEKYTVEYFLCKHCGYIQTEIPFWQKKSYINPINENDTGIIGRNFDFTNRLAPLLWYGFNRSGTYLDWAGGYGLFVRMMRDIGFDFLWTDPYAENIFAQTAKIGEFNSFEVTCFEVFEHLEHPLQQFEQLLKLSDNIVISTELFDAKKVPQLDDWYYYAPVHGQHISFYSIGTLRFIAEKYNLNLITNNFNLHLFTRRKIKHRLLVKFFLSGHRLLLLPFIEYIKLRMQSRTLTDSKLFDK